VKRASAGTFPPPMGSGKSASTRFFEKIFMLGLFDLVAITTKRVPRRSQPRGSTISPSGSWWHFGVHGESVGEGGEVLRPKVGCIGQEERCGLAIS
jgi:hypothetical protein